MASNNRRSKTLIRPAPAPDGIAADDLSDEGWLSAEGIGWNLRKITSYE
jgi:hypothetical protein